MESMMNWNCSQILAKRKGILKEQPPAGASLFTQRRRGMTTPRQRPRWRSRCCGREAISPTFWSLVARLKRRSWRPPWGSNHGDTMATAPRVTTGQRAALPSTFAQIHTTA
jgi:hypothetical protein